MKIQAWELHIMLSGLISVVKKKKRKFRKPAAMGAFSR